jgi:hypothetical protein
MGTKESPGCLWGGTRGWGVMQGGEEALKFYLDN